jgi:hypothetical protein
LVLALSNMRIDDHHSRVKRNASIDPVVSRRFGRFTI